MLEFTADWERELGWVREAGSEGIGYHALGKGMPICFRDSMNEADRDALHYGEVAMSKGQLVTAGMIGYIMVVTGLGESVEKAREQAYARVENVVIPNCRYRNDIGARFISRDHARMQTLGLLG